jgi:hypothetical protein
MTREFFGSVILLAGFLYLGFFAGWPIAFGVFFMIFGAYLQTVGIDR